MTLVFALSIVGPGAACAHAALAHAAAPMPAAGQTPAADQMPAAGQMPAAANAANHGMHHTTGHDIGSMSSAPGADVTSSALEDRADAKGATPPNPSHNESPSGCGAVMSCSASLDTARTDAIDAHTVAAHSAAPVGPVLQQSVAERDVELPPPRR